MFEDLKNTFTNFRELALRPAQELGIDFAQKSFEEDKRFIVISAPTGSGKSLLALSICAAYEQSVYLVHSKPLQYQITSDFPEVFSLFGRGNYVCAFDPQFSAADCFFPGGKCPMSDDCDYKLAKQEALSARFRVLNYAYFLTEANYVGRFSKQPLIIVDEADSLEHILYNFIEISATERKLKTYGLGFPKYKTSAEGRGTAEWVSWGKKVLDKINAEVATMAREIRTWNTANQVEDWQITYMKQYQSVQGVQRKFAIFVEYVDDSWLCDQEDTPWGKRVKFKPLWLTPELTEHYLWKHGARFVLLSASFPPKEVLGRTLGINTEEIEMITLESTFKVENRTNYMMPVASLKAANIKEEIYRVRDVVGQIMDLYPTVKGLIHTVTYPNANIIMGLNNPRLITHDGINKQQQLDVFMQSPEPLVFVSPSSERGLSLADDLCRFIIVVKAPFLYLGDKSVKLRAYSGNIGSLWFTASMLMSVLQMLGRGVRNEQDHCTSFILDGLFLDTLNRHPSILPAWFRDSLILADPTELGIIIPQPLEQKGE